MTENREKIFEGLPRSVQSEKVETSDPHCHYTVLDALRGIAILGVVMTHLALFWEYIAKAPLTVPLFGVNALDLFVYGFFGLSLFALLSGYSLTWSEEKRVRRGTYSVRSYALRRALRLVPAYYVAILVVIVVWPGSPSVWEVLLHLSFLQALNHYPSGALDPAFWFLTSTVVFYCMLPFIILKLPRLSQRLTLFGVLFFASVLTLTYSAQHSHDLGSVDFWYSFLPTTQLWVFMAGVLLRKLVEHLDVKPVPRWQPFVASALFLGSTSFLVAFPYLPSGHGSLVGMDRNFVVVGPLKMLIYVAGIAFFASVLLGGPLLRKILSRKILVFIGTISYSMYLLNMSVMMLFFAHTSIVDWVQTWIVGRNNFGVWVAFSTFVLGFLVINITVSYLSYRFIESPFLRYKPK